MPISSRIAGAILLTTALSSPTFVYAQSAVVETIPTGSEIPAPKVEEAPSSAPETTLAAESRAEENVEVSIPGGDIIVTGRRDRNLERASQQVISILSTAEIARTGEGNIAGALGRVTGLSVVGSGYVYVRGLGDRYSLALLNGSPLPARSR